MTTKNGSGIHGLQPKGGLLGGGGGSTGGSGMIGSSARGRNRSVLRKAFGNTIHTASTAYLRSQNTNNKKQTYITNFNIKFFINSLVIYIFYEV